MGSDSSRPGSQMVRDRPVGCEQAGAATLVALLCQGLLDRLLRAVQVRRVALGIDEGLRVSGLERLELRGHADEAAPWEAYAGGLAVVGRFSPARDMSVVTFPRPTHLSSRGDADVGHVLTFSSAAKEREFLLLDSRSAAEVSEWLSRGWPSELALDSDEPPVPLLECVRKRKLYEDLLQRGGLWIAGRAGSHPRPAAQKQKSDSSPGKTGGFGKCEPLKAAVTEPLRGSLNPLKGGLGLQQT